MDLPDDQKERTPEGSHKSQIQRFGEARNKTCELLEFIYQNLDQYDRNLRANLRKEYAKVKNCGNYLLYHHYYTIDEYRLIAGIMCQNKWLDALCGLRWADKAVQKYYEKYKQVLEQYPEYQNYITCMITLTVKNRERLTEAYTDLDKALKRVSSTIRNSRSGRTSSEFGKIKGMVGSIEVKKGKGGKWHPHFHAFVILDDYIDKQTMTEEWYYKTDKVSFITDIRESNGDVLSFCEVLSYTLKVSTLLPQERIEAWWKLSGKQMIRTWGIFRKVKLPEQLTDDPIENLPYTKILYRYVYKEGYTLEYFKKMEQSEIDYQKEMDRQDRIVKSLLKVNAPDLQTDET